MPIIHERQRVVYPTWRVARAFSMSGGTVLRGLLWTIAVLVLIESLGVWKGALYIPGALLGLASLQSRDWTRTMLMVPVSSQRLGLILWSASIAVPPPIFAGGCFLVQRYLPFGQFCDPKLVLVYTLPMGALFWYATLFGRIRYSIRALGEAALPQVRRSGPLAVLSILAYGLWRAPLYWEQVDAWNLAPAAIGIFAALECLRKRRAFVELYAEFGTSIVSGARAHKDDPLKGPEAWTGRRHLFVRLFRTGTFAGAGLLLIPIGCSFVVPDEFRDQTFVRALSWSCYVIAAVLMPWIVLQVEPRAIRTFPLTLKTLCTRLVLGVIALAAGCSIIPLTATYFFDRAFFANANGIAGLTVGLSVAGFATALSGNKWLSSAWIILAVNTVVFFGKALFGSNLEIDPATLRIIAICAGLALTVLGWLLLGYVLSNSKRAYRRSPFSITK